MRGRGGVRLFRATCFADTRTLFQKLDLPAGETTVMHEFVAPGAAGPSAAQESHISVQSLAAHVADPWLNAEQHRRPFSTSKSNAHERSIANQTIQEQGGVHAHNLRQPDLGSKCQVASCLIAPDCMFTAPSSPGPSRRTCLLYVCLTV